MALSLNDGTIRVWAKENRASCLLLRTTFNLPVSLLFSRNGKRLAIWSADGPAKVVDIPRGGIAGTFGYPVAHIAFAPDSQSLAQVTMAGCLAIYSFVTRSLVELPLVIRYVSAVPFSPNGTLLAVAFDKFIPIYRKRSWTLHHKISFHEANTIAISPDGRWLAVSEWQVKIMLLNLRRLGAVYATLQLSLYERLITQMAFSSDR